MKDLIRKDIQEKMKKENPTFSDSDSEDDPNVVTPVQELKNLKKSFLEKIGDDSAEEDSEDDFLVVRKKDEKEEKKAEEDFEHWEKKKLNDQKLNITGKKIETKDLLEHFWAAEDTNDPNEKFLRRYFF